MPASHKERKMFVDLLSDEAAESMLLQVPWRRGQNSGDSPSPIFRATRNMWEQKLHQPTNFDYPWKVTNEHWSRGRSMRGRERDDAFVDGSTLYPF